MKLNQKGAVDIMFVVLIIVVAAVGYFVYTRVAETDDVVNDAAVSSEAGSSSRQNASNADSNSEEGSANETTSSSIPDGWTSYESSVLGLSFAYPSEWGDVVIKREDVTGTAGAGSLINGGFENEPDFRFSSATVDFNVGRGGDSFSGLHKGWEKEGNELFTIRNYSPESADNTYRVKVEEPMYLTTDSGGQIPYVINPANDFTGDGGSHIALFNLNSSEFGGLAFGYIIPTERENSDNSSEIQELTEILDTLVVE